MINDSERAALAAWSNNRLSPEERIAQLQLGAGGAPPVPIAPVANLAPAGAGGAPSEILQPPPTSVAPAAQAPGALPPSAAEIAHDPALSPVEREQASQRQQGATVAPSEAGSQPIPGAPIPGAGAPPGQDPRLALMAWQPAAGAAAAKPTEKVQEETQVQVGALTPRDAQAYAAARERADAATIEAARQQGELEQRQQAEMLRAAQAAQAEREDLAHIRDVGMKRAQDLMRRQDEISREIADTDPVEPSLYAGKNFGESMLTALSLMAFGAGAGATGTSNEILPFFSQLANREVDKQARLIAAKRGAVDAFGSILERHVANLQDIELAKKATIADLLGMGELNAMRLAKESAIPMLQQRLTAQSEQLRAARLAELAQLQQQLGDRVMQQTSLAYVRERAAAASPTTPGPALTGEALDAQRSPSASAGAGARPVLEQALQQGKELWNSGQYLQALHSLPPAFKNAVSAQAGRLLKGKSLGDNSSPEDAKAYAVASILGWQVPKNMVPQAARDRVVTLPDGRYGFVSGAGQTLAKQKELDADGALVASYRQLIALAQKPSSKWSPSDRAYLESFSRNIKPMLSVSLGQGAMAEAEQKLYDAPAGGEIGSMKDWLLGTGLDAAKASLAMVQTRLRARLAGISESPFDRTPISAGAPIR